MNTQFQQLMSEAARLTRSGDLSAATAAIQSALANGAAAAGTAGMPRFDGMAPFHAMPRFDAIDVEAFEIKDPAGQETATAPPAAKAVPGSFTTGSHGSASLKRDYKLYIPPTAGSEPLPLVVMLHGCTQNPDDFAAGTAMNDAAQAQGFYVLYPAQSRKANPQGCWNWFKHSHQQRGRGEAGLLADMTREVMTQHGIDPERVYVAGLSAGGAMAAILGAEYPDVFAAVGVHSGLAAGAATDLPSALSAMKSGGSRMPSGTAGRTPPTIVFHGDADATVHPVNGDQVAAACAGASPGVDTQRVEAAGVRACTRRVYADPATGRVMAESWLVHGAPHAWSGGSTRGSYTDSRGPDATAEMLRFFFERNRQPLQ
jgi:poly(hydroxyalkanoate) depolymerase family esterase